MMNTGLLLAPGHLAIKECLVPAEPGGTVLFISNSAATLVCNVFIELIWMKAGSARVAAGSSCCGGQQGFGAGLFLLSHFR
jgi:hypothetical protein